MEEPPIVCCEFTVLLETWRGLNLYPGGIARFPAERCACVICSLLACEYTRTPLTPWRLM